MSFMSKSSRQIIFLFDIQHHLTLISFNQKCVWHLQWKWKPTINLLKHAWFHTNSFKERTFKMNINKNIYSLDGWEVGSTWGSSITWVLMARVFHLLALNKNWVPLKRVKTHYAPPKIVVTKTKIMHFVSFCTCKHHMLDYFCSFQIYCISFKLKIFYLKRISNKNLQTWTYEVYLCQNKYVTWYEKLQIYFKTKVMGGVL
jgi:hypothetical protein